MAGNNADYLRRLKEDGHHKLLAKIEAGEMSPYAASIMAGYRKKRDAPSRAEQIAYHWKRASLSEKRRFLIDNWKSIAPLVGNIIKKARSNSKGEENT